MLAVLPFENLTGDPDQEYISDGMTEELIAQLGGMDPSRLGVIARQSAMQFKKTTKRADQIGSDLGVSHLLAGSLRRTGSRIRIAVQLIDTESESQLWAEQYERDAADLLTLQREVAEAITRQITTKLGVARSNVDADARRHSTIAEAYDHYLRGRHHLWRRDTVEGFEKAREHFQRAIDLDASYAHAYSGLSDTYTMLGTVGLLPMREAYPLARAAALKAIELDGMLAEAHTSLAFILADYDWDWDTADRHFRSAVELNPNYETAVRTYSGYLAWWGRDKEALEFAGRARDLDPVSPNARQNLGLAHYFARRYDDAITQFREALDLDPNFGQAHVMLGRTYVAKGLPDRAVEELERAKSLMGARPDVITPMAYVLAQGWTPARGACDARRIAAHREATGPIALSSRLRAPRPRGYGRGVRLAREISRGSRLAAGHAQGRARVRWPALRSAVRCTARARRASTIAARVSGGWTSRSDIGYEPWQRRSGWVRGACRRSPPCRRSGQHSMSVHPLDSNSWLIASMSCTASSSL